MPAVLQFQAISKSFGQQFVLRDINLIVESGEFLTLLGPSGSGKTTLLRLAAGFERPDSGAILLNREEVSQLPPYQRRVNTVFQNYALFPHLNVYRNVAFGLVNLRLGRTEIDERVKTALEMVQMSGFESRLPAQLSGGQQQRVAVARALVMQPAVLLLDEPFGALDQKLRQQMQVELKALQRKLSLAFVFVTHDQQEALSLSDRIVLLNGGRLEQTGAPEEIYNRPKTRFGAEFMGIQNILALAEIAVNGNCLRCRTDRGEVFSVDEPVDNGEPLRFLAVRPRSISISHSAPVNEGRNVLQGRVSRGNYLGDSVLWSVEVAGRIWQVSQPLQKMDGVRPIAVEDEVFLAWDRGSGILVS
jgi:spermidine/putrescine transport system ATP-binding protein